ncbi:MAG: hypothetical protein ACRC9V_13215 [Aeromonas sp.]
MKQLTINNEETKGRKKDETGESAWQATTNNAMSLSILNTWVLS